MSDYWGDNAIGQRWEVWGDSKVSANRRYLNIEASIQFDTRSDQEHQVCSNENMSANKFSKVNILGSTIRTLRALRRPDNIILSTEKSSVTVVVNTNDDKDAGAALPNAHWVSIWLIFWSLMSVEQTYLFVIQDAWLRRYKRFL